MRIVFFGPPGSGKGTQAKLIASQFNISHLSTGDILRKKLKEKDKISIELKQIISKGNLVSDDLLNKIITEKIKSTDCEEGFILDGYPRTLPQSDYLLSFLEKNNLSIDFIFDLKVDFQVVEERVIKRSKDEKRSDDNLVVVKTRLNNYTNETLPVSVIFKDKYNSNYFSIDASKDVLQIQKELVNIIKKGGN